MPRDIEVETLVVQQPQSDLLLRLYVPEPDLWRVRIAAGLFRLAAWIGGFAGVEFAEGENELDARITALDVKPGDILALFTSEFMSHDQTVLIQQHLQEKLPGVKAMVLHGFDDLKVIRPKDGDEMGA